MSHTYAILEVPRDMFEFVKLKLLEAGYQHAVHVDGDDVVVDMHGIALRAEESTTKAVSS